MAGFAGEGFCGGRDWLRIFCDAEVKRPQILELGWGDLRCMVEGGLFVANHGP